MGTEETTTVATHAGTGRRRRTFTKAFKSEAIECCLQLGVSMAAVARAYDLHPNLLRRWVVEHRATQTYSDDAIDLVQTNDSSSPAPLSSGEAALTAFVPLRRPSNVPASIPAQCAEALEAHSAVVRIELRSGTRDAILHWPAAQHQALSQLLRAVLA